MLKYINIRHFSNEKFLHKGHFDLTYFVTLCERLTLAVFEVLYQAFINGLQISPANFGKKSKKESDSDDIQAGSGGVEADNSKLKDTLIISSTVAHQDIKCPTDFDLLYESERTKRVNDISSFRIVSISQPFVGMIIRGKSS